MSGLAVGSLDRLSMAGLSNLNANITTAYTNFTPPAPPPVTQSRLLILKRDVSSDEVKTMKFDVMPGFRFIWWYSGLEKITPDTYTNDEISIQFVR